MNAGYKDMYEEYIHKKNHLISKYNNIIKQVLDCTTYGCVCFSSDNTPAIQVSQIVNFNNDYKMNFIKVNKVFLNENEDVTIECEYQNDTFNAHITSLDRVDDIFNIMYGIDKEIDKM